MRTHPLPLALLVLTSAAAAQTDDASLLRCAAIGETSARLACYDTLAQRARQRAASPAAAAPAAAPAAAAATPSDRASTFGLAPKPDPDELQLVRTHLPGPFQGWSPKQRFTLANGQVWEISDDSSAFGRGNDVRVTLRRGTLGSYFIEFDGVTKSPRARRVE